MCDPHSPECLLNLETWPLSWLIHPNKTLTMRLAGPFLNDIKGRVKICIPGKSSVTTGVQTLKRTFGNEISGSFGPSSDLLAPHPFVLCLCCFGIPPSYGMTALSSAQAQHFFLPGHLWPPRPTNHHMIFQNWTFLPPKTLSGTIKMVKSLLSWFLWK